MEILSVPNVRLMIFVCIGSYHFLMIALITLVAARLPSLPFFAAGAVSCIAMEQFMLTIGSHAVSSCGSSCSYSH
jgi:hypothetical protein